MNEETVGWLYYNPDTGIEFDTDHPINSGKIEDAQNVRPATATNLLEELKLAWEIIEEERSEEAKMGKKWIDATGRAESAERKLAMAVEASKAIIHLLKPAKGEAHGQLDGVPDSHLFELVWARDDDGPQDYPCITAGQLRRFIQALTELEKADG